MYAASHFARFVADNSATEVQYRDNFIFIHLTCRK